MPLSPQQQAEVSFWLTLKAQYGDGYFDFRCSELKEKTKYFEPHFSKQEGKGLDLGCGLVSVLERSGKGVIFCDPLINEYRKIEKLSGAYHQMESQESLQPFTDSCFDWIFCVNVIDHTPDPQKLIDEIKRTLKSDGTFYFQVMFDPELYAPHYSLWSGKQVRSFITSQFEFIQGAIMYHPEWKKDAYWGVFKNKK